MRSTLFASFIFILVQQLAHADSGCAFRALRKVLVKHDAAAELELDLEPAVMRLLTSKDGTLVQVLDGEPGPRWLGDWMKKRRIQGKPKDISWESLSYDQQKMLLQYVGRKKGIDFFENRSIRGLKVRDVIELQFDREVIFEGKRYPKGKHKMPRRFLMEKVEYGGPTAVQTADGVELHYRRRLPAGDLIEESWKLEEGMGMKKTHLHIHMVAPLLTSQFKDNLGVARQVDFIARSNLAAEMVTILESSGRITTNETADAVYFNSFGTDDFGKMADYFKELGRGKKKSAGSEFKMGWIGVRGPDSYDQPGLWGLEYRAIDPSDNPKILREVLNGIQSSMVSGNYGVSESRLRKWLGSRDASDAIEAAWYNSSWSGVKDRMPADLDYSRQWLDQHLKSKVHLENHGLKMIFHDWKQHPLFFDRPAALAKILKQQKAAIAELQSGTGDDEVIGRFLLTSGVYKDVLESVGVKVSNVKRAIDNNTWEDIDDWDDPDGFDDDF